MRFLVQRTQEASVTIDGEKRAEIRKGFLVLIGVSDTDTETEADRLIKKMIQLRIFEDDNGKTNLSLKDVNGELLLVSQFTLYANCRKGNRPSFLDAGAPDHAQKIYHYIVDRCREQIPVVETGEFGADMKVSLINDGPFTIMLDTEQMNG